MNVFKQVQKDVGGSQIARIGDAGGEEGDGEDEAESSNEISKYGAVLNCTCKRKVKSKEKATYLGE